jgi:hypothetical protein
VEGPPAQLESESGAESGAESESGAGDFWSRVVGLASEQTSDMVLIDQLVFVEKKGGRIRLRLVDGSPAGDSWITSRLDRIQELLKVVSGRPMSVELMDPEIPALKPSTNDPDPKFKENLLVREALELFDATIHSVRELPDTMTNPGGAADDV